VPPSNLPALHVQRKEWERPKRRKKKSDVEIHSRCEEIKLGICCDAHGCWLHSFRDCDIDAQPREHNARSGMNDRYQNSNHCAADSAARTSGSRT